MSPLVEVTHFGRVTKLGRNHVFTLLRAKGWIDPKDAYATDIALRNGWMEMVERTSGKSRVYYIAHFTVEGLSEFMKDIPNMLAYVPWDAKRERIAQKVHESTLKVVV